MLVFLAFLPPNAGAILSYNSLNIPNGRFYRLFVFSVVHASAKAAEEEPVRAFSSNPAKKEKGNCPLSSR